MFESLIDLVFFNLYGTLVIVIALFGAIPYAAWQGLMRLKRWVWRSRSGDTGAGS